MSEETTEPETTDELVTEETATDEQPQPPEETPTDQTDEAEETFPRAVVEKLRKENAGYRQRAQRANAYAERLHLELVRATGKLADPSDLPFDETYLDDPEALAVAIDAAQADAAVRALLITGQPGIFTSGNDLEDFMQRPPGSGSDAQGSSVRQFMRALLECDKPVVAAVTGAAIGIGTTMLLHCDLVYVSDEARLAMPFVGLGLVPEYASSLLVPALVGHVKAAEKLMLGDPFTGEQAVEMGIANAVLPATEVLPHARRMAERFNALPPAAVRETKRLMRAPQRAQVQAVMDDENRVFGESLRSPEAREAMQAFFEKRAPDFSKFS